MFNLQHNVNMPLASRMRPNCLDEYLGQAHLTSPGKPLSQAVSTGQLHSMILWGPPGTGKTTLAELLTEAANAHIEKLSAVLAGVKDIRAVIDNARQLQAMNKSTVVFVDEVHRFNKAQQDAFLPHIESGLITFIGATTENPSFELNNALLSRSRVYILKSLQPDDLIKLIDQAIATPQRGLGDFSIAIDYPTKELLAAAADGDARICLNSLEIALDLAVKDENDDIQITSDIIKQVISQGSRRFDKGGDYFYQQISALHKSVRGSDPDAALYWFCRMLDGGCDPRYVIRRVIRMATEDIGNADPRALNIAITAADVYERLGSPEGELAIAQAVTYLACAAKSNAVYVAYQKAQRDAKQYGSLDVPLALRNAPTQLLKKMDYGKDYRYAHDEDQAFAAGMRYFPEKMPETRYYQPVERGLEIKIKAKLDNLRKRNEHAKTREE